MKNLIHLNPYKSAREAFEKFADDIDKEIPSMSYSKLSFRKLFEAFPRVRLMTASLRICGSCINLREKCYLEDMSLERCIISRDNDESRISGEIAL